jgi:hypothetical protein
MNNHLLPVDMQGILGKTILRRSQLWILARL